MDKLEVANDKSHLGEYNPVTARIKNLSIKKDGKLSNLSKIVPNKNTKDLNVDKKAAHKIPLENYYTEEEYDVRKFKQTQMETDPTEIDNLKYNLLNKDSI